LNRYCCPDGFAGLLPTQMPLTPKPGRDLYEFLFFFVCDGFCPSILTNCFWCLAFSVRSSLDASRPGGSFCGGWWVPVRFALPVFTFFWSLVGALDYRASEPGGAPAVVFESHLHWLETFLDCLYLMGYRLLLFSCFSLSPTPFREAVFANCGFLPNARGTRSHPLRTATSFLPLVRVFLPLFVPAFTPSCTHTVFSAHCSVLFSPFFGR